MQRQYWQFYWPLTLMGLAGLVSGQCQNAALARYPDAARELTVFALATSVFFLFHAALGFVPQLANVFVRSPAAARVCLRFTAAACVVLACPVAFLAFTAPGEAVVARVFDIGPATVASVIQYLRYLLPLMAISGLVQYYTGLLIQARRTGLVTLLNVAAMAAVIAMLLVGRSAGWPAPETLGLAMVCSAGLHLALTFLLYLRCYTPPDETRHEDLTHREAFAFFWPVAVTSMMFALSRPILYLFVNRSADGVSAVAALRVVFSFTMIFHLPLNEFRHLFVTFGPSARASIGRFMVGVLAAATALMVLVAATPLSTVFFRDLLGVRGRVLRMASESIWVLCLIPLVVGLRNYFHGLALAGRRTGGMAVGAVCRTGAIYVAAWALYRSGRLGHVAAAAVLVLGFGVEALSVALVALWRRRRGSADRHAAKSLEMDRARS